MEDNLSLNPCFSGGWSRSTSSCLKLLTSAGGLNPCFSGGWSRRAILSVERTGHGTVLILVLVEDGLGDLNTLQKLTLSKTVLILVLVEDGLGVLMEFVMYTSVTSS